MSTTGYEIGVEVGQCARISGTVQRFYRRRDAAYVERQADGSEAIVPSDEHEFARGYIAGYERTLN